MSLTLQTGDPAQAIFDNGVTSSSYQQGDPAQAAFVANPGALLLSDGSLLLLTDNSSLQLTAP